MHFAERWHGPAAFVSRVPPRRPPITDRNPSVEQRWPKSQSPGLATGASSFTPRPSQ
jgi:hypothetical protein